MNKKCIDSCIQMLKRMLGDKTNELGSEQQRKLAREIRKLKRLRMQPRAEREEIFRIVNEVAETVSRVMNDNRPK